MVDKAHLLKKNIFYVTLSVFTEQTGLPYFDRAAVKANGNWYYASALESMGNYEQNFVFAAILLILVLAANSK